MKNTYSLYEAKAKLSEIVRWVKQNKTIIITLHDTPVARVIPYSQSHKEKLTDMIKDLEMKEIISQPKGSIGDIKKVIKKSQTLKRFLESRD